MVLINYATKEIVAKIVYYGPALCGKTTNLQYIYTKLNPKKRGKMISLATESDRTLFFDFLPMELGKVQGFKVRFQLYTVPGQVFYGATRKLVLKGADAVVFVADSQEAILDMNLESIEDMKENLIENNLDPETIPIVFQYNKRDLKNVMSVDELNKRLNWRGAPFMESVALTGPGVMESFMEITKALIRYLKEKHSLMDTDAIGELPPNIFQEEEVEQEVLEAEEGGFVIEHGSGYGEGSSGEEEVVAGEMLDMVETISLADATRAEEFFDDVRKGVPTEEAREKVLGADTGDNIELSENAEELDISEQIMTADDALLPVGERELTPEELEFADQPSKPAAKKQPAASSAKTQAKAPAKAATAPKAADKTAKEQPQPSAGPLTQEAEKRLDALHEAIAKLAKDVSIIADKIDKLPGQSEKGAPQPQPDKRIDVMLETQTQLAKDISQLSEKLDKLPEQTGKGAAQATPDKRIDVVLETQTNLAKDIAQLSEKLDKLPAQAGKEAAQPTPDKRIDVVLETQTSLTKDIALLSEKLDKLPAQTGKEAAQPAADKRMDVVLETQTSLAKDIARLSEKLDKQPAQGGKGAGQPVDDKRLDAVLDAQKRLAKDFTLLGVKLDNLGGQSNGPAWSPGTAPESGTKDSLERIEQEISALRLTLTMMKESTTNALHAVQPSGGSELKEDLDELMKLFKEAFEGQDRLLLAILEGARESKLANSNAHEKLEDALRYIAGNVGDDKGGKKKWF